MLEEGKIAKLPPNCPTNGQKQGGGGTRLADSKFSTRVATWISPGNFVSKQGGSRFRYRDRIAKFIRALLISEEGEHSDVARPICMREINQKGSFMGIGDASSNFEQVCGHVGSRTTLENYPLTKR